MKNKKQLIFEVIIDIILLATLLFTGWMVVADMFIKILLVGAGLVAIGYKVVELKNILKNN